MHTHTHKSLMGTPKEALVEIAIANGGTTEMIEGNRVMAVKRLLTLLKDNAEDTATDSDSGGIVADGSPSEIEPRRPYGHGQLASIHWSRYRVGMTPKLYAAVGAPRDPWGSEMVPIDPAYFGADPEKSLENLYIGDKAPVAEIVEKGPPKKRGRKPGFKAPANTENASQADIEAAIAAMSAELERRKLVEVAEAA